MAIPKVSRQFVLFVLIGLANTIFSYGIFALFVFLGLHYTLAVFLSTCIGILFSFKTMGRFVFKNPNNKLIVKFVLVYSGLYFVNISLIKLFLSLGSNTYAAGAIATFFCAMISYTLNRHFVFKRKI